MTVCGVKVGFFLANLLVLLSTVPVVWADDASEVVDVVLSNDFPPYSFPASDSGEVTGMLPDLWALWSEKTGIPVRLHAERWGYVEPFGPLTVFGTAARTKAREEGFLYGPDPVSVPMYLYADRETGGVTGVEDLRGRSVGVVGKGSCNNWLMANGVSQIEYFKSFTEIVRATVAGRLSVFCSGQTAAIRYLNEFGQADRFVRSPPIFQNDIHWMVRKGEDALYDRVVAGFARITPEERRRIEERWLGKALQDPWLAEWLRILAYVAAAAAALAVVLMVWTWMLRRRVGQRTRELRRTLEDLRRSNHELTRSNEDLDSFAYFASHDLKSPLRGIDQLASWIEEDYGDALDEEGKDHLRLMRSRVNRMERLLNDLLTYSRVGRHREEPSTVDTKQLVTDIFVMTAAGYDRAIRLDLSSGMPTLTTRKTPLEMVFRNLIGNAFKHHDKPDGVISVSGSALADTPGWYAFTVADDGPGIPAEHHQRVFAMLQTLKPRDEVEGTGIGLAIVKKTVEAVGGTVSLESDGKTGAVFRFTWPDQTSSHPQTTGGQS